jgi:hypothetical protein
MLFRLTILCFGFVFTFIDEEQLLIDRLGGRQFLKQYNVRMVNVNPVEDDISVWDLSDVQLNDQTNTNDNWLKIMTDTSNIKWKQMTARKWTHEGHGNYSLVDLDQLSIQKQVKEIAHALESEVTSGTVNTLFNGLFGMNKIVNLHVLFVCLFVCLFIQPPI